MNAESLRSGAAFVATVALAAVLVAAAWTVLYPKVRGLETYTLTSGSMEPVLSRGDIVMVQPFAAGETPEPGAIITVVMDGATVTHRVIRSDIDDAATASYTLKGDANRDEDSTAIADADIVGAVVHVVPFLGLVSLWVANPAANVPQLAFVALVLIAACSVVASRPSDASPPLTSLVRRTSQDTP